MEAHTPEPSPPQTPAKERSSRIPGFDPEATPLLGIGLGLTGLTLGLRPRFAPLPLALTALAAALYRDPERVTPPDPQAIYAPADGSLLLIDEIYEHRYLHTDCVRMAIAVSPLDVPICRSPAAGTVRYMEHVAGQYGPVSDIAAGDQNERVYMGIETAWGPIMVVQIAGPLGRRIVPQVAVGDALSAGARLGTVRFGSRTDLYLQRDVARLLVESGQHVVAGLSRIGDLVGV
ncbi:phosphatidylserine decarboxylase-related protein [Oscillochloris trichoides DG-6]|uniref:Phosphatidylserine decarboxylase-related protein n=1 Tax=Oscillochloris trichoides DG-6 TaxID=765420 RepID=E1IGP7_9CHLR|nr:phosphatidylserine decarboxylase [Oscillochloris trichoides]EFO79634.1 phosphatidylserine decarboxylase-related protein [Oscillochloris trichoides DG-6]